MYIREANPDDNDELQQLQAQCPQGQSLIISTVNTPDFFARAKAYASYRVYVACEDSRIVGSAALAIHEAVLNGDTRRVGYEFQYFTSPDYRRQGVARSLHQHIEAYFREQDTALSFLVTVEGNLPSIRLFESQGYRMHRALVVPVLLAYKAEDVPSREKIRSITSKDLDAVAELLNQTWQGYDLYEPHTAESLAQLIDRLSAYSFDNLLVLEDRGEILACLGYWDWSQITQITVQAITPRLRMIGLLFDVARLIRPMPRTPMPGTTMKQWSLTPIGFKDPAHLVPLLRFVNNQAVERGVDQICCVCERSHALLGSMKGLFRTDVGLHLLVKPLEQALIGDDPVFLDGIDI